MALVSPVRLVSLGDRIVDLDRDALLDRQGAVIPLRPRAWLVLKFLAQRAGRLVEKNELLEEVWADCVVTEDSLVQAIGDIRRALGDASRTALRTLPRRGYMLMPDQVRSQTAGVNIGDRLRAKAEKRFVGRDSELAELGGALAAESGGTQLYFVHGPGGIGKTTLLERLKSDAARAGICLRKHRRLRDSPHTDGDSCGDCRRSGAHRDDDYAAGYLGPQ